MRMMEVLITVVLLGILAISLSVMQIVLQDFSDDTTANSFARNSTTAGQEGLDNIAGWQSTMGTVVAVAFILTLLIGALLGAVIRGRGGQGGAI